MIRPFFVVPGSKWRKALSYPFQNYETIIEPFAGAAGYSSRNAGKEVILIDNNPDVIAAWRYLISVSPEDLKALPDLEKDQQIDDLSVSDDARQLIKFWTSREEGKPNDLMVQQLRSSGWWWGKKIKEILAEQVELIRHWKVIEGNYTEAPDVKATWFIDPPRETIDGVNLREDSGIDYLSLGTWCKSRKGQIIVCEYETADWIPLQKTGVFQVSFSSLIKGNKSEAFWEGLNADSDSKPTELVKEENNSEIPRSRIRRHDLIKRDWLWKILEGDCLERLKDLPDNSIDAVITDPPCGISFLGAEWDSDKGGRDNWIAWLANVMKECLRILKPGGHALVWALPRTSHWTGTALEDAGFEIRDYITYMKSGLDLFDEFWKCLNEEQKRKFLLISDKGKFLHGFGSGFPKHLDVSIVIDKAARIKREIVGRYETARGGFARKRFKVGYYTVSTSDVSKQWEGWGTGIKPAFEPWMLSHKPISTENEIYLLITELVVLLFDGIGSRQNYIGSLEDSEFLLGNFLPLFVLAISNVVSDINIPVSIVREIKSMAEEVVGGEVKQLSVQECAEYLILSEKGKEILVETNKKINDKFNCLLQDKENNKDFETLLYWAKAIKDFLVAACSFSPRMQLEALSNLKNLNAILNQVLGTELEKEGIESFVADADVILKSVLTKIFSIEKFFRSAEDSIDLEVESNVVFEDWWLIRKPLEGTIADNIMRWGTGALNVVACRVGDEEKVVKKIIVESEDKTSGEKSIPIIKTGNFPSNVIIDGSDEVNKLFPEGRERFLYCAKPSLSERDEGMAEEYFYVLNDDCPDEIKKEIEAFLDKKGD